MGYRVATDSIFGVRASRFCRDPGGLACAPCSRRIILLSLVANTGAVLIKAVVGLLVGSQALVADAVHSFSDSVAFGINYRGSLRGSRLSREDVFYQSLVISALMLIVGVWIVADNVVLLMSGVQHRPGLLGVVVAGLSVFSNSYLYSISACAARRFPDPNLYNCMVQNKTNCFAAFLALAGVVLADLGLLRFDAISALMIGLLQFIGAFEIMRRAALDNVERAFSQKQRALVAVAAVACLIIGLELYHFGSHRDTVLIPSHGTFTSSSVDGLLGRADYFIVYDTRKRTVKPVVNAQRMSPNDVSDTIIKILEAKNVDIVLTRRIGEEMFSDLQKAGVRIYLIDKPGTVSQIFSDFQQGQLKLADGPNVARGFGRTRMHWLAPW